MADSGGGIGGLGSGLGSVSTASAPTTSQAGPIWDQTPFLNVVVGGVTMTNVLGATIVMGLDVTVASATIELAEDPGGIPQNVEVTISCGTGPNNLARFNGLVKRKRSILWPHKFILICRGKLGYADKFKQAKGAALPSFLVSTLNSRLPIVGISMADILAGADATDDNYIVGVLNLVPGLSFDPSDIDGTHHIFGGSAFRELLWPPYVTALAQCQKLDEVCLGFRLYEGLNGKIFRTQVFGYPTNVSDTTFTEGIDIWDATGDRSIEDLANAMYVEGYIFGGHPGIIGSYINSSNDFQSPDTPTVEQFSSPLIEDLDFADQVAAWKLGEKNRELVNVELVTFRDNLLWPGRTISVVAPHGGLTEPVWMQHVEIQVRNEPVLFEQRIRGIGGGTTGGSGIGNYPPPDYG